MRIYKDKISLKGKEITKDFLLSIFDYRDGCLYWKVKTMMPQQQIGDRAGTLNMIGYRRVGFGGKTYLEHRLIWFMHNGVTKRFIDHRDGNPLNNRIDNLRIATRGQNSHNRGKYKNNSSGYKGVSYTKSVGKWGVRIVKDLKQHFLGYFDTPEQGHEAYKKASIELHAEFAQY